MKAAVATKGPLVRNAIDRSRQKCLFDRRLSQRASATAPCNATAALALQPICVGHSLPTRSRPLLVAVLAVGEVDWLGRQDGRDVLAPAWPAPRADPVPVSCWVQNGLDLGGLLSLPAPSPVARAGVGKLGGGGATVGDVHGETSDGRGADGDSALSYDTFWTSWQPPLREPRTGTPGRRRNSPLAPPIEHEAAVRVPSIGPSPALQLHQPGVATPLAVFSPFVAVSPCGHRSSALGGGPAGGRRPGIANASSARKLGAAGHPMLVDHRGAPLAWLSCSQARMWRCCLPRPHDSPEAPGVAPSPPL